MRDFELAYRRVIEACIATGLPPVVCTIYHGSFPDTDYQQRAVVALTIFNDVIIRVAVESRLRVIDLRFVATLPADFVNAIEPSACGGEKIARAIVHAVTEPAHGARGANIVAG